MLTSGLLKSGHGETLYGLSLMIPCKLETGNKMYSWGRVTNLPTTKDGSKLQHGLLNFKPMVEYVGRTVRFKKYASTNQYVTLVRYG